MAIGINIRERDESLYVNSNVVSPVLTIIGTATKGEVGTPILCTSQKDFKSKFGVLNPNCYGTYAAQWYLSQVSRIYYLRVADETAANSSVNISGTNQGNTVVSDAIVLESNEVGTFYDGYVVVISNSTDGVFDMGIKTSENGALIHDLKGVTLDDTSPNYIGEKLSNTPLRLKTISDTTVNITNGSYKLTGGSNGTSDISDDIVKSMEVLKSSNYSIDLLTIPGVSDAAVVAAALAACEYRGDTLYIVDPPAHLTYEEVANWTNGSGDFSDHTLFNSSFGACYWSWQYIYDEINNMEVLVPPSVLVAPAIARSEYLTKPWYAPAGLTRGLIRNALRSETLPNDVEVDYLYESPNCVNCIITHDTAGLVVWGQKTMSRADTSLNRVNVRRLITYIKRIVKKTCQFLIFEPNDSTTWVQFEDLLDPVFRSLVQNRGLYDYRIVPMTYTVTDNDIDNGRMPAQILIKPTKAAEFIPIDIVLTSTGVEFSQYIQNLADYE